MVPSPFDELTYRDPSEVPTRERDRKIRHAMIWLRGELMDGPRPAQVLIDTARAQGIPLGTLQHAKKRIYAHSERRDNRYYWSLPVHPKASDGGKKG